MNEDCIVKILNPVFTPNTIGEKVATYQDTNLSFKAVVQPNSGSMQLKMYGLITGESLKVYTTAPLPDNILECHLGIDGVEYRIIDSGVFKYHHTKLILEQVIK